MAVRKEKRIKAVNALVKAGMAPSTAARYVSMLDLDADLAPQIAELAEDMADLFDGSTDDAEDDEDTRPMTSAEAKVARLRGTNNPLVHKRPRTERKSTAPASAQEAAAHLRASHKDNPPPTRKYIEPVRDINAGHKPTARQRPTSADVLAAKLRGN